MALPNKLPDAESEPFGRIDWEAFYRDYRKPGYVSGFEIVNKLGGGMFGLVFKARKESIGKDYAIKFLKVDDESVRDAVARELDSVRYFAQLDHPNLVSIEDMGEVDGIPYLVMSYAGQETLRKRLEQGRMSRDEALRIFVQAARGVQALHERSLVHFDIKPANIFLKGDIARVGDFGLSKLVTESRNSLSFGRGTPYYMAPEMLQRRGDVRSDVYSLGVLMFECLCGDVPFKGDSEWEVLRKHEHEAPEYPEHVSNEDRRILGRCLQKDPNARYQSVADLLRDMQAPVALGESLLFANSHPATSGSHLSAQPLPPSIAFPAGAGAQRQDADAGLRRPALGDSIGVDGRNPADSPYGLPWGEADGRGGILALFVRVFFRLLDVVVMALLLPVQVISAVAGRGAVWLLRLPFKVLGFAAQLVGYAVVAALVLLVLVVILAVVGAL
jgi:serine/threonine protein kinase